MQKWALIVLALCVAFTGAVRAEDAGAKQDPPPGETRVYDIHDFLWGSGTGRDEDGVGGKSRAQSAEEIVELIGETVQPGTWKHQGGKSGEIIVRDDRLVIRATTGAHGEIASIFSQFRESTNIQG